jgi:hypothetical protein
VRNIGDFFDNSAHLGDLDPRYDDENDDVRDPFVLGEAPEPEWIPRAPRSASRARTSGSRNGAVPRQRSAAVVDWREAVRRWLVAHPGASYKACRNAVRAAGHVGVSREDVAEVARALHASSATKRKTTRGATTSRTQAQTEKYRKHVPKPEKPSDVIDFKIKYCESCSMAIRPDGGCRC